MNLNATVPVDIATLAELLMAARLGPHAKSVATSIEIAEGLLRPFVEEAKVKP